MDQLDLLFRPTMEALIEEDDMYADDEKALSHEQGVRSEPRSIHEGATFKVLEGMEAVVLDDCQCFLECDKADFCSTVLRNGIWIDPESVRILSAGRYLYRGDGIVQRIQDDECIDALTIGIRQTKNSEELSEMSEEDIEDWERDVLLADYKPREVFKIRRYNEGVLLCPPCVLEYDRAVQPIKEGDALPAGEYLYVGNGVIQRAGWQEVPLDCTHPDLAKVKADFVQILTSAFPEYEFKFERADFYCKLEAKWVNIFEHARSLLDERAESGWMLDSLGSADDARNKKFLGYQVMRDMVETVRDKFFKPHNINVEIKRMLTFQEFSEM